MNIYKSNWQIIVVCIISLMLPLNADAFLGELDNVTKASLTNSNSLTKTNSEQLSKDSCISSRAILHINSLINPFSKNILSADNIGEVNDIWGGRVCQKNLKNEDNLTIFSNYKSHDTAEEAVEQQVKIFSRSKGGIFVDGLSRAGSFMPILKKMLAKKGLPEDLAIIPLIESGYNNNAHANDDDFAGPWQFMKWTAQRFGLKINYWVDERHDPIKSTNAAAKYLKLLFDKFGTWELALIAYNRGEGNIEKIMDASSKANFWSLYQANNLSPQTYYYVHKFIAAREIVGNLDEYGYNDLAHQPLMSFDTVTIKPPANLSYIAKATGTSVTRIKELNPELKQWCIPPDVSQYELRIPSGTKGVFLASYESRSESERYPNTIYKVKKGDTLFRIAKKKGVPVDLILKINDMTKDDHIHTGMVLILPPEIKNNKKFRNSDKQLQAKKKTILQTKKRSIHNEA
jgi:membrane-bound lytic murein transglycosylase D